MVGDKAKARPTTQAEATRAVPLIGNGDYHGPDGHDNDRVLLDTITAELLFALPKL